MSHEPHTSIDTTADMETTMHTADTSETTITRRRRRRIAAIALATAVALGGLTLTDTSSDSGDEIAWFGSTWS